MDLSNINFLAVAAAALSTFLVGWIWYGPIFGKAWQRLAGISEQEMQQANMGKIFGLSFLFELVMAFNLAMFFFGSPEGAEMINAANGALYGFLTGFGWVFFAYAVTGLFEQRSWKQIGINGGYWAVAFTVMGLILGAWK